MTNFFLIFLSLGAGILIRRLNLAPKDSFRSINIWILYIALPALSLKFIPAIEWSSDLIFPAIAPVIVWIGSWLSIYVYNRFSPLQAATTGSLKLSSGLANTSFLGFPLIAAYYSEKEISIAIICDQVTFILLSTVGMLSAMRSSEQESPSFRSITVKALKFPPFIAFLIALTIPHFVDISPINPLLGKLIGTMGPLALFSIGLQLQFSKSLVDFRHLSFGLFYKLLLAPALVLFVAFLFKLRGTIPQIAIFEAAMPTLVTGSILADKYNLNPQLANLMVGAGILLAFFSTAAWWKIMQLIM